MNLEPYYLRHCYQLKQQWKSRRRDRSVWEQYPMINGYRCLLYNMDTEIAVAPHTRGLTASMHTHDFFEIVYVYRGACQLTVHSHQMQLREGDICMMNLQAVHSLQVSDDVQNIIFNVLVKKSFFDNAYFELISKEDSMTEFFLNSLQNKRLADHYLLFHRQFLECPYEACIQKIIQEYYEHPLYQATMLNLNFIEFLIELTRSHQKSIEQESRKDLQDYDLSEIIRYMIDHYENISLSCLAGHFNYTTDHLSHLIKKYSGTSFSDLLQNIRFKKAAELIRTSDIPIPQVMESVGYTNRTWFNKKFKERYGVNPREYRNSI